MIIVHDLLKNCTNLMDVVPALNKDTSLNLGSHSNDEIRFRLERNKSPADAFAVAEV